MNGFLLGLAFCGGSGRPSGPSVAPLGEREGNCEKNAIGVKAAASAGGGRPVILAYSVRSHRSMVKMPRKLPREFRNVASWSATLTMAKKEECVAMYVLSSI